MRLPAPRPDPGFALVIVMVVIVTLTIMAAGFAYSMKVEMRLAQNTSYDSELIWLGRSGVELGRYVLGQKLNIPGAAGFDSLNQKWAGGPGDTNDFLSDISLVDNELGRGRFSVHIVDFDRRININNATPEMLRRAVQLLGFDNLTADTFADSVLDWRDPNSEERVNGAETPFYMQQTPPHISKDGPIDDISELLLIRGVTLDMYWGSRGSPSSTPLDFSTRARFAAHPDPLRPAVGLADLFTATGSGRLNLNTASPEVLRLLPGIDDNLARGVVHLRAGPDGIDGTEDDTPLHNVGELINVPGMQPAIIDMLNRFCDVRSRMFEIRVEARLGDHHRTYVAVVNRASARQVPVLNGYWE